MCPQRGILRRQEVVHLAHGIRSDVLAGLGVLVVGVDDASVGDGVLHSENTSAPNGAQRVAQIHMMDRSILSARRTAT